MAAVAATPGVAQALDPQAPPVTVGSGPYLHAGRVAMPRKGALDCRRALEAFGYRPRFDIRAGIAATLEAERALLSDRETVHG